MAEVSKSRLALDLEEIERQLRHSSPQPSSSRSDPLAELARIVGQDDPFRALLAGDKPSSRSGGDIFARREPLFDGPGQQHGTAGHGLRGSLEPDHAPHRSAYQDPAVALTAEEEAILRGQHDPRYSPPAHEAEIYFQEGSNYADPESTFAPVEPRRSRKGLIAIGAILGAAVIGTAGALALRPGSLTGITGGEPPVVKAETAPSKVAPLNPGGVDIPNQNKQIYERSSPDTQTRVVNREEQPVDVRQAVRTAGEGQGSARVSPAIPPGAAISGSVSSSLQGTSSAAAGILGEPRRVRTVSIRPDGTVIPEQGAPVRAPAAASPQATMVMPSTESPSASPMGTAATVSPGAQGSSIRMTPPQRPRDVTSTPVTRSSAGASAPEQPSGTPLQITPDSIRSKTDSRVAAAPQTILREPTETSAAPTTSPGFSVQLGVRNTEREGRVMFEQLQKRFTNDLGGFSPLILQAEINGKPGYRVRVGPMSRDDAVGLCSRLKTSGGQCYVANN
jgi:hypothetical protein